MQVGRKLLPLFMAMILIASLCPMAAFAKTDGLKASGLTAQSLDKSADDAMNWLNGLASRSATCGDGECVALIKDYYNYLGRPFYRTLGNAENYCRNAIPDGFTRLFNVQPQKGDILVFTGGKFGHVCIYESDYVTYHQNYADKRYVTRETKRWSEVGSNFSCVIRPVFANSLPASGGARVSVANGAYIIQSKIGNRIIDIDAGASNNNANAQLWQPLGSQGQMFNIGYYSPLDAFYIQARCSDKYLDAEGGEVPSNVSQYADTGGGNQNWIFEDAGGGYVYIRNLGYGYMDVSGGEDRNGANVQVVGYNGTDAQKWKIIPVSGKTKQNAASGTYVVYSKVGNRVIDIDSANITKNNANARTWQPLGTSSQIFKVGTYDTLHATYFQVSDSDKYLDAEGGVGPTNVSQYQGNGSYNQNWFLEDAGSGYVYIRNLMGYYLDVSGGKDANGTNIQVVGYNGTDAQKWKLVRVSGKAKESPAAGSYTVKTKLGDFNLDVQDASTANNANVRISKPTEGKSQVFKIGKYPVLDAIYLELAATGKYLDAEGGVGPTNVSQYQGNGSYNQNWFFEDAGSGCYFVRNLLGYYLEVEGAKAADGQNVRVAAYTGADAQMWKLAGLTEAAEKTSISKATVTGITDKIYTGNAIVQAPVVKLGQATLEKGVDYAIIHSNNVNAGVATITLTGAGAYTGSIVATFEIARAENPAEVIARQKTVRLAKVRGKARKVSPLAVKKAQGTVTYSKVAKGSSKRLAVDKKTGRVTVKKGTKKGTYRVKVKVSVAGNGNYKPLSKTVTTKVRVR